MKIVSVALVSVEDESTLKAIISPVATPVVQVLKARSSAAVAELSVGFSDPVIVSATVGGKLANVSFHTSTTIEPEGVPTSCQPVIVPAYGIVT
jgi:hypothetical protein